ncbi:MAG: two-component system response regulator [Candidatus Hydrogenedentes bacterium]|nr:two-component system response regulator [Candidatus Hydrogenedentota bacterium]
MGLVLVVDDLVENTLILKGFIKPLGFEVVTAQSGEEALKKIEAQPPDIILLDLMMPGMSGFEVTERLKENPDTRHIPIIIVTGLSDPEANVKAIKAGADDFLIKPFDRVLLEARIRASFKTKRLQDEILQHRRELEMRVRERTRQVELTREVALFSLARLAESRDAETGDHLERIRCYVRIVAEKMVELGRHTDVMTEHFVEEIYLSSPLHDVGKVGTPDRILLKPGPLSDAEFAIMKTHSLIGGDALRDADYEAGQNSFLAMGRDIAYYHHERWDGKGYPNGLKGVDIPLAARIVTLADVYDALTSKRPYKEAFSHERAREIILAGAGKQFDPDVIDAFLCCEEDFMKIRDTFQNAGEISLLQQLSNAVDCLETDSVNG